MVKEKLKQVELLGNSIQVEVLSKWSWYMQCLCVCVRVCATSNVRRGVVYSMQLSVFI